MDKNEFRDDVKNLIKVCTIEVQHRKTGINGESTIEQLENTILPELNQLLTKVDNNQLPPLSGRYLLSFANAFKVWGWDMNQPTEIFVKLADINNNYSKI